MEKKQLLIASGAVLFLLLAIGVVAAVVVYKNKQEGFGSYASNSIGHSGGFSYKRLGGEMNETAGAPVSAEDIIGQGNHPLANADNVSNIERLSRQSMTQMMPRVANNVVPFDVSVADPNTYLFRTQLPAVQILTRQAREADPYRGDVPITYHPDIPLVERSKFGRDAARYDGFFSDAFSRVYDKYTNKAHINRPSYISNQGTIMS